MDATFRVTVAVAVGTSIFVFAAALPARAEILACEERDRDTYTLAGHSKKHKQLAFRRTLGVCEESDAGDSGKAYHKFQSVEVYKYSGDLKRKFFWSGPEALAQKTAGGKLPAALKPFLEGALARDKIEGYLESGKFAAVEASLKSPNEICALKVEWGPEEEGEMVPMRTGKVVAVRGKKKSLVHEVKTSAKELDVQAYWYAKGRLAAVVTQKKVWHPGSGHCCDYQKLVFAKVPGACGAP